MNQQFKGKRISTLVECVKSKAVSPVEVIEDYLRTVEKKEPELKAWVTLTAEHAINKAKQIEKKIMRGEKVGLLAGVPYAAKDVYYTAGIRTTASSKVLADFVPEYDAALISVLDQEDAILLGKCTTAEFACSRVTQTRNPWNSNHSPGGTSSGSAAVVASDMALFALGTQTGGSLLRPSAYCGLVSMKATLGRLSRYGVIPVSWSLDHTGPMTRTVGELALTLHVLSGYDQRDEVSLRVKKVDRDIRPLHNLSGIKIGLPTTFFFDRVEADVKTSVENAVKELKLLGADVVEIDLPEVFNAARAAHRIVMRSECSAYHDRMFLDYHHKYGPALQGNLAAGRVIPQSAYVKAQRIRRLYIQAIDELFEKVDIIVTPTAPNEAPAGEDTGDSKFNSPFTLAGIPAMTVPCGLSGNGLPIGMQLIGKALSEELLLSVGAAYEQTFNLAGM